MASGRSAKRRSGQERATASVGKIKAPAALTMPIASAALDVFAYPHLLSLILDSSSTPTLATLLRCSKAMLKTISPRLYRRLHLTPLQLKAMLETGWMAKGGPNAFSTSLFHCLQQTQTLHVEAYDQDITYSKVPRGLFTSCTSVILHIDEPPDEFDFQPLFQSLGSHLYIRLTDASVLQNDFGDQQAIAVLTWVPRSFSAVTFLIPHAYRFSAAPSCGYSGTPPPHSPAISVVLIPWALDVQMEPLQKTLAERWLRAASTGEVIMEHKQISRYIGMEYTAMPGVGEYLLCLHPDEYRKDSPGPTRIDFVRWLADLEDDTVFGDRERDVLLVTQCELSQAVGVEADAMLMEGIQQLAKEDNTAKGKKVVSKGNASLERRKAARAEMAINLDKMKELLSRGESLKSYLV